MAWKKKTASSVSGTPQQEAIWDCMANGNNHVVVRALAGTGKTFTVIEGFNRLGTSVQRAAFVAFNKSIARELQTKVPQWVEASTFHSMLFKSVVQAYGRQVKVDSWKTSYLLEELVGEDEYKEMDMLLKNGVEKLVGLVKNTLTGHWSPDGYDIAKSDLDFLCERFGVELNGDFEEACELVTKVVQLSRDDADGITLVDFDDMIWLPIVNNLPLPRFDLLAVDESQDTNRCQQEALERVVRKHGTRLWVVGDENQAIYGFRGADTESMSRMVLMLEETDRGVDVMPLTQTRRCPKSHVELAKKIVPTFEAMAEAPEGSLEEKTEERAIDEMKAGDLVLCRTNAPVVRTAFRLLKAGVPANIQGRDIGKGLKGLVNRLTNKRSESVLVLIPKIDGYEMKELEKLKKLKRVSESRLEAVRDKCACLRSFCDGVQMSDQVIARIEEMFTDVEAGETGKKFVLLSSVHRAKGLEADTVWVLYPELMPHPMAKEPWAKKQEMHVRYVALTRSKNRLVFIPKPVVERVGGED